MQNFFSPRVISASSLAIAATALSACSAQGYNHGTQYAGENCNTVSAQNCGRYGGDYNAQISHQSQSSRRGKTRYGYSTATYEQFGYSQPSVMLRAAPSMNYQQPSYQTPTYTPATSTRSAVSAPCPIGTTAQADGTCLEGSSTSYVSTSMDTTSYTPSYSSGYITSATTANCPAGTSPHSDGTCLEGASTSLSHSSSSYSSPIYSSPSNSSYSIAPPISMHDFSDYNWGSNDTTWGSADYVSPGTRTVDSPNSYPEVSIPSPSYWPSRK